MAVTAVPDEPKVARREPKNGLFSTEAVDAFSRIGSSLSQVVVSAQDLQAVIHQ